MRILGLVRDLGADDLVLCLLSGGGSALLAYPVAGFSLAEKQALTARLLRAGAPIAAINCVRKHLSAIKGGRLALAGAPTRIVTLAISDTPGDDPSVLASGPTVGDPTTVEDARAVLRRYAPGFAAPFAETPKPDDPRLAYSRFQLIARPRDALDAAAAVARRRGLAVIDLGADVEGEAREVALRHARLALQTAAPAVILSGGETTVTVRGGGTGGRNTEYLLALVLALAGRAGIHALAADTDGIDGEGSNAGAYAGPDTLARAAALGLDGQARLAGNDSHGFFAGLGDLLVTGPTRTNVNDFRAILVLPS
jgi:hydroxypyruvate reductase